MLVCLQCFNETPTLKSRFDEQGIIGTCEGCHTESVKVLDAADLSDLFEGLRNLYRPVFDRYTYGKRGIRGFEPGEGDDSLSQVLVEEWEVFSDVIDESTRECILGSVWPQYFGAYMSRGTDVDREVRPHWDRLKQELKHVWRYFRTDRDGGGFLSSWLDPFLDELESELSIRKWWRARIQEPAARAFRAKEMSAPPCSKATAGRANASGISHLYVASREATAVAEISGEPGDCVTVAEIRIQTLPLKVLDLTKNVTIIDPFSHSNLETAMVTRELLQIFANELSRPIRASDQPLEYVITQFLSEYFRRADFAGILFPSALDPKGINAVFFYPSVAKAARCKKRTVLSKVVKVGSEEEFKKVRRRRLGLPT